MSDLLASRGACPLHDTPTRGAFRRCVEAAAHPRYPVPSISCFIAIAIAIALSSAGCASATTASPRAEGSLGSLKADATTEGTRESDRTIVGVLGAAPFRVDIPAKWNGELILFCHGYSAIPKSFEPHASDTIAETFCAAGFAVAQSGYSASGYAVAEAVRDTEALRSHFVTRFGTPRHTWITGESLGGSVTMMLLETHPESYDGGLPMCAPLGAALSYIKALVFDTLVLFEYWFPSVLPSPGAVPSDFVMTEERPRLLARLLDENAEGAAVLRRHTTARTNRELSFLLDLFTYILAELRQRWGGNPFDNRNTIYVGFEQDRAINDGVKRYAADLVAQKRVIATYTPTGLIRTPMLALRTLYDPILSAFDSDRYSQLTQLAGRGELFVQKYTGGEGHCNFSADERRAALLELRRWKQAGIRPSPGLLEVPATSGTAPLGRE